MSTAQAQLAHFVSALEQVRAGDMRPSNFSTQARTHTLLLQTLPARYAEVLHQLLDRLESSALFSEESCSFSQQGLLDSLQQWADKAAEKI